MSHKRGNILRGISELKHDISPRRSRRLLGKPPEYCDLDDAKSPANTSKETNSKLQFTECEVDVQDNSEYELKGNRVSKYLPSDESGEDLDVTSGDFRRETDEGSNEDIQKDLINRYEESVTIARERFTSSKKSPFITSDKPDEAKYSSNYFSFIVKALLLLAVTAIIYFLLINESTIQSSERIQIPKDIEGIVNSGKYGVDPFVLLLVHRNLNSKASELAERVGKTVANGRKKNDFNSVRIDGKNVPYSCDSFMEELRPQVEKIGVLTLLHVDYLHVCHAHALHFILDRHTPWVPQAVYILTMELTKPAIDIRPTAAAELELKEKWGQNIKDSDLGPLVTRITDLVYEVKE